MPLRSSAGVLLAVAGLLLGCGADSGDAAGGASVSPSAEPAPSPSERRPEVSERESREGTTARRRGVRLVRVGRFSQPLQVTAPEGDRRRVFVVERGGTIRVIRGGRVLSRPFLDISGRVTTAGSEQGLLGLAFPPDHDSSGRFYVHYTNRAGDTRVVEYRRASPDRADAGSARVILAQQQPEPNHNGGQLAFGPDGLLYIGLGDGGGANDQHGPRGNAQDLSTLLGKILRIDPRASGRRYRVPASNPFTDRQGARGEIYAYGLRNPWRFSFDPVTGDLTIGDVGQDAVEEIDHVGRRRGKGANFGWRPFEGNLHIRPGESASGHVRPVITRSHEAGWCSIIGGVVVRDRGLPALYGRYVFGDFCQQRIYSARLDGRDARGVRRTRLSVDALSSFGRDGRGRVYATSLRGPVYRLAPR